MTEQELMAYRQIRQDDYNFGKTTERTRIIRTLQALANDAKKHNYTATAESYEQIIRIIEKEINIITISESERREILNAHK